MTRRLFLPTVLQGLFLLLPLFGGEPADGDMPEGYEFLTAPEFLRLEPAYVERMTTLLTSTPNEHRSEVILRFLTGRLGGRFLRESGAELEPEECVRLFTPLLEGGELRNRFVERLMRRHLAVCYQEILRPEEARRVLEPLGFLRNWYGVRVPTGGGALGIETRVDVDPSLSTQCRLGWRQGEWVPLFTGSPDPEVDMSRLSGLKGDILYLQVQFHAADSFSGYLLLEADFSLPSPAVVRLDDIALVRLDPSEREIPRTIYLPLRIEAGWHRLLVKVASSRASFACSLVRPDGTPFLVEEETAASSHAPLAGCRALVPASLPVGQEGLPAPQNALLHYGRLADDANLSQKEKALVLVTRAMLAFEEGVSEDAYYRALGAVEALPSSPVANLCFAIANTEYDGLPEGEKRNRSTQALEKVLAQCPEAAGARLLLAGQYSAEDKLPEAAALLGEGLDLSPASLTLHIGMLRLVSEAQMRLHQSGTADTGDEDGNYWFDLAREQIEAIEALVPGQRTAVEARLDFLRKRALPERAYSSYKEYAARHVRTSVLARLANLAALSGDIASSIKVQIRLEEAGVGGYPQPGRQLTTLMAKAGLYEEAAKRLRISCGQFPFDAGLRKQLGEVLHALGEHEEAMKAFEEALSLDPSDFALRRFVEDKKTLEPFYKQYEIDLVTKLPDAPGAGDYPDSDTARLVDQTVVRVYQDGSHEAYTHEAVRILTPKGVEAVKHRNLSADEVLEVRTILPDGSILEPNLRVSGGQATMPGLTPGAVVEYKVLNRKPAWHGTGTYDLSAWFFQDPSFAEPFIFSEYVLEIDREAARRLDVSKYQFDKMSDPEPGARDDYVIYKWTARDMPRVKNERLVPHVSRFLPAVHVRSRGSWLELAAEIAPRGLDSQHRPSRLIRERAAEILKEAGLSSASPTRDKVDALYRFVCRKVETEGGEQNAEAVLRAGTGDRTSLLLALVRAAGVDVYPAMMIPPDPVLARGQEPFDWFSPRLLWERTTVAFLEDGAPYRVDMSDSASRYAPPGLFEADHLGGMCFVSLDGVGRLLTIEREGLPTFPQRTAVEVMLKEGPEVEGNVKIEFHPAFPQAPRFKQAFSQMDEPRRNVTVQQILAQIYRGAVVEKGWHWTGKTPDEAFAIEAHFKSRHLFAEQGSALEMKGLGLSALNLVQGLVGSPSRELPFVFPLDTGRFDSVTVRYDASRFSVSRRPSSRTYSLPFAVYNLAVSVDEAAGEVRVERRYNFRPAVIPAADYPDMVRFCRRVDASEQQSLTLEKRDQ